MGLLQTLGTGQGYLKAGFLGFAKSGKTYTATELAIGVWKFFGLKKPIAFFDTEGGSEYVAETIVEGTGQKPVGARSRSLGDLIAVGQECVKEGIEVLIADSMTHVWRELLQSYLLQVNEGRKYKKTRLTFDDWGPIKDKFGQWTEFYLNSRLHILICGRAGYEYDWETNQETGKTDLVKTGVKMKTESEFGFEPSLLVEMERVQEIAGKKTEILHRATVIGDRFGVIDGQQMDNPKFEFFLPHLKCLKPGAFAPIDTSVKTDVGVDEEGEAQYSREKRQRTILCEEIQGLLLKHYPSQSAPDKAAKAALIEETFKTHSWTKVESLDSATLRAGLEKLRARLSLTTSAPPLLEPAAVASPASAPSQAANSPGKSDPLQGPGQVQGGVPSLESVLLDLVKVIEEGINEAHDARDLLKPGELLDKNEDVLGKEHGRLKLRYQAKYRQLDAKKGSKAKSY